MDGLIPDATEVAAKRGFIRTTAQAYAATLSGAVVTSASIVAMVADPQPLLIAAPIIAGVIAPPIAGLASYFSILAKGIPGDYQSGDA